MESKIDSMTEELNSVINPVEKNMLLQKYGLIEPKLTDAEKSTIYFEENPCAWDQVNFLQLPKPWEATS